MQLIKKFILFALLFFGFKVILIAQEENSECELFLLNELKNNYIIGANCPFDKFNYSTVLFEKKNNKTYVVINKDHIVEPEFDSQLSENYLYIFTDNDSLINRQFLGYEYLNEGGSKDMDIKMGIYPGIALNTIYTQRPPAGYAYSYQETSFYDPDSANFKLYYVSFESPFFGKTEKWAEYPTENDRELLKIAEADNWVNPYGYQIAFYVGENNCTILETSKNGIPVDKLSLCDEAKYEKDNNFLFFIKTYKGNLFLMKDGTLKFLDIKY